MPITLAKYLQILSEQICEMNGCDGYDHNCASYAYIDSSGRLIDVCQADYFQGSSEPVACIPLPWTGDQKELDEAIDRDLND